MTWVSAVVDERLVRPMRQKPSSKAVKVFICVVDARSSLLALGGRFVEGGPGASDLFRHVPAGPAALGGEQDSGLLANKYESVTCRCEFELIASNFRFQRFAQSPVEAIPARL